MKETAAIQPPDEKNNPCTDTLLPQEFINPPSPLVEINTESRLVQLLRDAARDAAKAKSPNQILIRSAVAHYRNGPEIGNALADLAVTGRKAYAVFQSTAVSYETLIADTTAWLADMEHVRATPDDVDKAVSGALNRAYAVAWALRGPKAHRVTARKDLHWIAVSGEDDTPHRPVNVPSPEFDQYEISVTVNPRTMPEPVTVKTRFFVASAVEDTVAAAIIPSPLRALPLDPVPHIPNGHQVILFLHGHSSSADEAMPIIPEILKAGLARGEMFSVISFDLPNSGYSETFDHTKAAESSHTTYPGGIFDRDQVRTPILDFEEDFVVAFVDALHQITPIKNRFAGVIGGSLGGNLGLRLGRRDRRANPWLGAGIVSWSAASVWDPMIRDEIKRKGPDRCRDYWDLPETIPSRADYFAEVFDRFIHPVFVRTNQPAFWYSNNWIPCKQLHINAARVARRETYCSNFRQWHWRLAGEQLIYSHVDRVNHFDNNTQWRYEQNTVRQLLAAGADDNFQGSNIFDATRTLSNLMVNTPGESLFLLNTGHSIHVERPKFLAGKIVNFLFKAIGRLAFCDDQNKVITIWNPLALGIHGFALVQNTPSRLYDLRVLNKFDHLVQVTAVRITSTSDAAGAPVFTVESQLPFSVRSGQSYWMGIRYNGTKGGPLTGFVEVECDDPTNPIVRIPLSATVVAIQHPELQLWPTSLDLGTRLVGTTVWKDITIKNIGDGDSHFANIEVLPIGPFTVYPSYPASALPGGLAPGSSVVIRVLYQPIARGASAATLGIDVRSLDPQYKRSYEIPLAATAQMPTIFLAGEPQRWVGGREGIPVPVRDIELKVLEFGVAAPAQTSAASFWIRNVGDAPLTVKEVSSLHGPQGNFLAANTNVFPMTVPPGGEQEVPCVFNGGPVPGKSLGSEFKVVSDDPLQPITGTILLVKGRTAGPNLVEPIEFEQGLIIVGPPAPTTLTFQSDGTDPVTVREVKLLELNPGTNFSVSSAPKIPPLATLAPGTKLTLTVTLTATLPGVYEAYLHVVHDGNPRRYSQVRLLGNVP